MTSAPRDVASARSFDLDYRPDSYFERPVTPESRILGDARRNLVKKYERAGVLFDARLLKTRLTENELASLQRVHPSLCGGEDLPNLIENEVEVVRISFPTNIHGEVTSVRARPSSDGIAFRIVDEYDSDIRFEPRSSRLPLTMGQVISMIDTAEDGLAPTGVGGLVARWGWRSKEQGIKPEDMAGDVEVISEFYPALGRFYEWRFQRWLEQHLEGRG